jgi:tetratricopeptide (TPR) repeat protein
LSKTKNKAKNKPTQNTPIDSARVQSLLEQFHLVAQALHNSADQKQVEVALEMITNAPEPVQIALIKALANERNADAADVLLALHELSPVKEVRKEARRAMIQLEGVRIQPEWTPPIERKSPLEMFQALANPPRFWKGYVSDTRSAGEVNLLLQWEQGEDYREVRMLGFLLDYWGAGVKDFFTIVESKRSIEKFIGGIKTETALKSCSLAKGKRLIEEALEVNKKNHTQPESSYRMNISMINRLVLEAEDIGEETEEDKAEEQDVEMPYQEIERNYKDIGPDSAPSEVALGFIEAWFEGDFEFAYDLLAKDSSLREGLSKREWAAKRHRWDEEAQPENFETSFVKEHEPGSSGIWLPKPFSRSKTTIREVEIGWSLEMKHVEEAISLPELPQASVVSQDMRKRWYWTSYVVVKEQDRLRIQSMVDENARVQSLSVAELQKQASEHTKQAQEITEHHNPSDPDAALYGIDLYWHMMSSLYYQDAIIKKLPLERAEYELASAIAISMEKYDRAIVYLEDMLAHFPEDKAQILLQIAAVKLELSEPDVDEEDEESDEQAEQLIEEAEAHVRESLEQANTAAGHMILADILQAKGDTEAFDEAVDHLRQASKLHPDKESLAGIEHNLGEVAYEREDYKDALKHFQHLAEVDPEYSCVWYHLGETYSHLNQEKKAEENFRKSIELHPGEENAYIPLNNLYVQQNRFQEAREMLEQGLISNPESGSLLALLASVYYNSGDKDRAEEVLSEAEETEPDSPIVQFYRQAIDKLNQGQQ